MAAGRHEGGRPALPADLDRLLHDLRGPLNSAAIHLEIARRAGPDEALAKQSLDTIAQELDRLARMLPAAFAVLALEPTEWAVVDLGAAVRRALAEDDLKEVAVAPGPWPSVAGDAHLLGLAAAHLARNALEATRAAGPGRPSPRVGYDTGPDTVALVVRDWGVGLRSTNPRAAIRLSASQKPGRAGVGLPAVDRIARLHRGRLELAQPPGGGTEARLTLPADQPARASASRTGA
jgi:signal transduction histidine kinase